MQESPGFDPFRLLFVSRASWNGEDTILRGIRVRYNEAFSFQVFHSCGCLAGDDMAGPVDCY
jgi:hypothetical protein